MEINPGKYIREKHYTPIIAVEFHPIHKNLFFTLSEKRLYIYDSETPTLDILSFCELETPAVSGCWLEEAHPLLCIASAHSLHFISIPKSIEIHTEEIKGDTIKEVVCKDRLLLCRAEKGIYRICMETGEAALILRERTKACVICSKDTFAVLTTKNKLMTFVLEDNTAAETENPVSGTFFLHLNKKAARFMINGEQTAIEILCKTAIAVLSENWVVVGTECGCLSVCLLAPGNIKRVFGIEKTSFSRSSSEITVIATRKGFVLAGNTYGGVWVYQVDV
ncbi:MAG: uncharacterized protein A8A55_0921 [Amphiamblys sp. WSBS2006]|nr:MAG: uncharacterized protein A8A55_0921 [Amphiamblys sp. WSBS2006]